MEPFGTMEPLSEKRTWNRQKTSVGVVSSAGLACTYPLKSTGRSYRKAWCARAASGTMNVSSMLEAVMVTEAVSGRIICSTAKSRSLRPDLRPSRWCCPIHTAKFLSCVRACALGGEYATDNCWHATEGMG